MLAGYLIAYLNIDKVIKIIRAEDEPKPALIKAFKLTEIQADAILNMRLRSLRKLEEIEIRSEDKALRSELKDVKALLASEAEQWSKVGEQVRKVRDMFGPKTPLGKRRTQFADAPEHDLAAIEEAFVEREPVTVVVSDKGWLRTLKGHVDDLSGLTFKTDDQLGSAFFAETTSKLLLFATNGKFYSLDVAKLPGGRGHGEPIRMFIDMEQDAAIVSLFVNTGGRKFLVASHEGQGFVVNEDDCVGNTRKGKQVLNVEMPNEARAIATVTGDTVAVIGDNRKMLLFPLDQVPEMARGRGVRLQKYRDGGLSDIATFDAKDGLTWKDSAGREFSATIKELAEWRGTRADAGRLPPKGFPSRTSSAEAWSRPAARGCRASRSTERKICTCQETTEVRPHRQGAQGTSHRRDGLDLDHEIRPVQFRYFKQRHRGRRRRCDRCKEAISRLAIGGEVVHVGEEHRQLHKIGRGASARLQRMARLRNTCAAWAAKSDSCRPHGRPGSSAVWPAMKMMRPAADLDDLGIAGRGAEFGRIDAGDRRRAAFARSWHVACCRVEFDETFNSVRASGDRWRRDMVSDRSSSAAACRRRTTRRKPATGRSRKPHRLAAGSTPTVPSPSDEVVGSVLSAMAWFCSKPAQIERSNRAAYGAAGVCRSRHNASSAARLSAEDTIRTRLPMLSISSPKASGATACAIRAGAPMMPSR